MPPAIRKALTSIGLSEKESRVMLTLLPSGPLYASAIAREARLNRTTTYGILEELKRKGLAFEERRQGVAMFRSIDPGLLPSYIERRGKEILDAKDEVANTLPQLRLLRERGRALPKIRYFEGPEGVEKAFEDTLENNQQKRIYEITGFESVFTKLRPGFIEHYMRKRTMLGIDVAYVTPDSAVAREAAKHDKKFRRTASFIPARYAMDTEFAIYGETVAIFSFAQERPIAVLIEDATIAHALRMMFDFMRDHGSTVGKIGHEKK